jgi:hypothetical protein
MEAITTRTAARKPLSITVQTTSTMILPPLAGTLDNTAVAAWTTGDPYTYGTIVMNGGRYYWCITTAGGNAGATPPTHTDGDATDDTLVWRIVPWGRHVLSLSNVGSNVVAVARGAAAEAGKGIVLGVNSVHNEGYEGGPRPYDGAWYAIATGGTSTLALSLG